MKNEISARITVRLPCQSCHARGYEGQGEDCRYCLTCHGTREAAYPADRVYPPLLALAIRQGPDLSTRPPCPVCGDDDLDNPCLAPLSVCVSCGVNPVHDVRNRWGQRDNPLCSECELAEDRASGGCPGCGGHSRAYGAHNGCADL
jgi:hypothetical protein